MNRFPFHLAFPVSDLPATRKFYAELLGCPLGRESDHWIDFDFFGNQITAHMTGPGSLAGRNEVDGKQIPVPHFGAILEWQAFHDLADRLRAEAVRFIHEPQIRFKGQVGEQATMFLQDPSGNVLEFKSFKDPANIFAH